jgi:hypothetical protein
MQCVAKPRVSLYLCGFDDTTNVEFVVWIQSATPLTPHFILSFLQTLTPTLTTSSGLSHSFLIRMKETWTRPDPASIKFVKGTVPGKQRLMHT